MLHVLGSYRLILRHWALLLISLQKQAVSHAVLQAALQEGVTGGGRVTTPEIIVQISVEKQRVHGPITPQAITIRGDLSNYQSLLLEGVTSVPDLSYYWSYHSIYSHDWLSVGAGHFHHTTALIYYFMPISIRKLSKTADITTD